MRTLLRLLPCFLAAVSHGAIHSGDVILINMTQAGATIGGNWNEKVEGGNTPIGGDFMLDLVRFSDGAGTGVRIDWKFTTNSFDVGIGGKTNTSGTTFSFPGSGSVPTAAVTHLSYSNPVVTWEFSGLDDSLTYDISILDSHEGDGTNVGDFSWTFNDGSTLTIDGDGPDGSGLGEVVTVAGLTTNGAGKITLTSSSSGTQHINALELVAVGTPQPGSLQFTSSAYSGPYDGGSLTVSVERVEGSAGTVSVDFATANGTATAGTDYTATDGTLNWADGQSGLQSFVIPLLNNPASSGTEFSVTLTNPSGGAGLGIPSSATANIIASVGESFGTDLATYLTFDESVDPSDHSAYRLGASTQGTASTAAAVYGNARRFDGSGDRIRIDPWTDEMSLPDREAITVSLWFKANTISGQRVLFDDPAKHDALGARISDGSLQVTCLRDGKKVTVSTGFSDTSSWHNLVVVKNGDSLMVSLDGSQVASVLNLDAASGSSTDAGTGSPFIGTIDEVRIYRRALSAVEITALQIAPPLGPGEVWRGYYFAQTSNSGSAADGADSDGDGSVNLLERAFGTSPTDEASHYLPSQTMVSENGNDYIGFTYRRLSGGSGVTGNGYTRNGLSYAVEYDTDLTTPWGGGPVVTVGNPVPDGLLLEEVTVRLPVPLTIDGRQFVRLKVIPVP